MRPTENYGYQKRTIWFDLLLLMRPGMNLLAPSAHQLIRIYLLNDSLYTVSDSNFSPAFSTGWRKGGWLMLSG
jgi:hypothetical protein